MGIPGSQSASILPGAGAAGLERSCAPEGKDWIRAAPGSAGFERIEARFSGHAYDPHRHDVYALGSTLAGVQSFDYRGQQADSLTGNVIVIHPDERHDGRAGAAGGFRYRMLYLAPELVHAALGARASTLPFVRAAVADDAGLRAALALALGDLGRPLEPLERDRAVLAIAEALLRRDPGAARGRGEEAACATAVRRARDYLDAHCRRVVTARELEVETGLDRYQIARHFRRLMGTSPYRYLTLRRLDRARAMIAGGAGLAAAAAESGFADQAHMTRRFREAYGLSPGRFRALRQRREAGQ